MNSRNDRFVRAAVVAIAALTARAMPAAALDAAMVVAKVREALGIDEFEKESGAIRLTGPVEFVGQKGRQTFVFDSAGRFCRAYETKLTYRTAFDGKTVRLQDLGGEVSDLAMGDRTEALCSAWAITGHWFAGERGKEFTLDESATNDESVVLRMNLDDERASLSVTIDRATWLPKRWTIDGPMGASKIDIEGQTRAGTLVLPRLVRATSHHGMVNTVEIESAESVKAPDWSKELASITPPTDATFTQGIPAELETHRAPTGHLLVHPRVNGKDVGWFIFDSGAGGNIIDNRIIKEAGLESFGAVPAVGIGGAAEGLLTRPESLELGPMTMRSPLMIGLDLAFLDQHMGKKIAGIIGYGTFARCVVEVDQTEGKVSLHDPSSFKLADAKWTPLIVYDRVPCVPGRFEGHDAHFRLDTGAGGTVAFHAPTVKRLKLLEKRRTKPSSLGGVGGFKPARQGKIKWLEFGGKRHNKVKAVFATEAEGAFADAYIDGNIGSDLLGKSVIVLDYPNGRIAFKPKAETNDEAIHSKGE